MMDWQGALKTAWRDYRWWLLGGLTTLIVVGIVGTIMTVKMGAVTQPALTATAASRPKATSMHQSVNEASHRSPQPSATTVAVEVKGAVNHPGVIHLAAQQRIVDVIAQAGGFRHDADINRVNQAQRVADQLVIYVPMQGETVPTDLATAVNGTANAGTTSAVPAQESGNGGTASLNLNRATKDQLMGLTGVGEKKAQKIIDYRTAHGEFKTLDDLTKVPGFGAKTVQTLKSHLCLS
ncbi:helix-hairpin-helix domain-containing protein [Furfurilactobacillus sp. WILCCON 0119]